MLDIEVVRSPCPVCSEKTFERDSNAAKIIGLKPPFFIEVCKNCGFRRQNPRPSETEMLKMYENAYFKGRVGDEGVLLEHYPLPGFETRRYHPRHINRQKHHRLYQLREIKKHVTASAEKPALLEVGCGRGGFLVDAAAQGFDVYGIEPSITAVQEIDAINELKGKVYQGDIYNVPHELSNHKFDVIYSSHVIEHLYDLESALVSMEKLLAPGGIVYAEVPNQFSGLKPAISRALYAIKGSSRKSTIYSIHHVSFFSPRSMSLFFSRRDYTVTLTSYTAKEWLDLARLPVNIIDLLSQIVMGKGENIQVIARKM